MKKLLGILVLSLLLSGNAYAKSFSAHVKNYYNFKEGFYGSSKKGFKEAKKQAFENCRAKSKENDLNPKACLLYALQSSTGWETLTDREYEEVFWNKYVDQFEKTLKPDEIIQGVKFETKEEKKVNKEKIELAEIIDKAKATCQTLGFEQGTDKFSDCTLKLYSVGQHKADTRTGAYKTTKSSFCLPNLSLPFSVTRYVSPKFMANSLSESINIMCMKKTLPGTIL